MDACNLSTVCLGDFCSCGDITLTITGIKIGQYTMIAKFNGVILEVPLDATDPGRITIPNVFNENYTHLVKFVDSNNEILNNSWYSLNIVPCKEYSYIVPVYPEQYNKDDYDSSQYN